MMTATINQNLALDVIEALIHLGVDDFCVCPAARNSALVSLLDRDEALNPLYFYEERSAAFFALGRARETKKPVAIITTSGTATAELLPAVMEAYYSNIPLILVTADRPRRYRGTGAPQTAEQVGLYGTYVSYSQDLEGEEKVDLTEWDKSKPLHLNVCFEDPNLKIELLKTAKSIQDSTLDAFLTEANYPLVVVSTLQSQDKEAVVQFLIKLNCPLYLEAISGLREDVRLHHLQINEEKQILANAVKSGYFIDAVLRIGGVPTFRLWRDLDDLQDKVKVFSLSHLPFKGLVTGVLHVTNIVEFLNSYEIPKEFEGAKDWHTEDCKKRKDLEIYFEKELKSSPSLINLLSKWIPKDSLVYLGNSMPIREWDLAATYEDKSFKMHASRGVNGIDGQISTFLGLCTKKQDNFALLGDLTTLYDMAGPWILPQLPDIAVTFFVINNGGGKIFSRMFKSEVFQNCHNLSFKPLADMWGLEYELWESIPEKPFSGGKNRLIEIRPDNAATNRFYDKL